MVGLTPRPDGDGSFTVLAVSKKNGQPVVDGVRASDKLIQVDALQTRGATMGTVVDALRGKVGEVRTLVVERAGNTITIEAKVARLLQARALHSEGICRRLGSSVICAALRPRIPAFSESRPTDQPTPITA